MFFFYLFLYIAFSFYPYRTFVWLTLWYLYDYTPFQNVASIWTKRKIIDEGETHLKMYSMWFEAIYKVIQIFIFPHELQFYALMLPSCYKMIHHIQCILQPSLSPYASGRCFSGWNHDYSIYRRNPENWVFHSNSVSVFQPYLCCSHSD